MRLYSDTGDQSPNRRSFRGKPSLRLVLEYETESVYRYTDFYGY